MSKIVVLKGGISNEREISLITGSEIVKTLRGLSYQVCELDLADFPRLSQLLLAIQQEQADLVFNALHGGAGENGMLAGALELAGIPFTGSKFKPSCLAMDKYVSKLIVAAEGIPCPRHILMRANLLEDYNDPNDYIAFAQKLGLPLIVKPNDAGSSVGISIVQDLQDLKPAVNDAFLHCSSVLLEEYIAGRELTVSILDGKALPVVEIKPLRGWYDYHNKYTKGQTQYLVPAPIEESTANLLQSYALRAFQALSCTVYGRVDFRYNGETPYFLELNTLPGMTALSLTPMAAKVVGLSFADLLERIIKSSLSCYKEER
ncbi:MAG: D-alanine--D-alanine ligase [Candidatus Cloacimonadaceae bacterium]|jgi:D-alanine-D-alanine ligase|nr:D-alanine--D-alanine ligase [Candidatus Cloacimonadota bacterium]MDY0126875.1 D-alanine--D-alanine ligase [Candidatus Cloacimonadaceae bacterium]MCB5254677.1 D-alanine--D-alanine ligase [Candidatus Cloacimonadota bacterium]MCK9178643.1 D-alanine--D-alanine ligase [Candidatus Cloacimonadota bacterium]MCK9241787.1 D-alanine--D-alanine ligase [Candidatus Cloacimonadota bacterium]